MVPLARTITSGVIVPAGYEIPRAVPIEARSRQWRGQRRSRHPRQCAGVRRAFSTRLIHGTARDY